MRWLTETVQTALSVELPEVYARYLQQEETKCDALYGADELVERNLTDEAGKYAPGYVIIGSDGGDERYLMKSGAGETTVYAVDVGDMHPAHFTRFGDFAACLARQFAPLPSDALPKSCDIVLTQCPAGGMKDLAALKAALHLPMTAAELLALSRSAPQVLIHGIHPCKAARLLASAGALADVLALQAYHIDREYPG